MTVQQPPRNLINRAAGLIQRLRDRLSNRRTLSLLTVDDPPFARYREYYERRVSELAVQLESGAISLSNWQREMRTEIERLHTTAYAIGAGGVDNIDFAQVDAIISRQTRYLDAWASSLRDGQEYNVDTIRNRAMLYLDAATDTLQRSTTTRLGLPPLPAYPGDGTTRCMVRCRCRWVIEPLGGGDANVYWSLGRAEHCPTCLARAARWSPVRIRGGVVQAYSGQDVFFRRITRPTQPSATSAA